MNLPTTYIDNMTELLGKEEFDKYLESFSQERIYGLRVNTSKISVEEFERISPFKLERVPWISNGFYISGDEKPAKHPYYFAGLYYLQEPSAMTPAFVMPVNKDDIVLDLCAAPGGKSTELGSRLMGSGLLVSNDISASRAKALLKNIEVFGIGNTLITCEYPDKLLSYFGKMFDKILIDAPCSGEGMFRKDGKLIRAWESEGPGFYSPIQKGILKAAADMLKEGGYIVYSTCTFSKEEDENVIKEFLDTHEEFELEKIFDYEGFVRGFDLPEAIRLFPHRLKGEGHFVCLLHKKGELVPSIKAPSKKQTKLPSELMEFLSEIHKDIDTSHIVINGENVYLETGYEKDTKGLRVLRRGLLLGEIKKNRFEPSQALAMTLKMEEYSTIVNLSSEDINVIKYLKGETIEISEDMLTGKSKNVLVCVDGYSLGWGRINNLTIKNRYLPGWRWM